MNDKCENKRPVIRDDITGVAKGYKHGLFAYGGESMGKSCTVLDQLGRLAVAGQMHNRRMTGKGLFLALKHASDAIHVVEDMERLFENVDAQGVLRSAMWAQSGHERIVTWTTAKSDQERFVFRGGLILINNRPLADLPELRALATRIEVLGARTVRVAHRVMPPQTRDREWRCPHGRSGLAIPMSSHAARRCHLQNPRTLNKHLFSKGSKRHG